MGIFDFLKPKSNSAYDAKSRLQFIVAQSGNTIHQVVTDPGIATTGEGERLRIPKKQ